MVFKIIYLLPLFSTFIGWFTNFLAIKMLFHPKKKVNLFFFSLQGIFPKRKKILAEKLASMVSASLLSEEEIKKKILEGHINDEFLIQEVDSHLDKFLKEKINHKFPMLSMFINDDIIRSIKEMILEEFTTILPELKKKVVDKAFERVNVKEMVEEKVNNFSLNDLENLLFSLLKKEFKFIEISGGVLGFLIGVMQLILVEIS